jgi:hypothetical protein
MAEERQVCDTSTSTTAADRLACKCRRDSLEIMKEWVTTYAKTKSSIEVTKCTSSNILVWFGRDAPEKSVAGLRESLISSPFEKFAKGLAKYRK